MAAASKVRLYRWGGANVVCSENGCAKIKLHTTIMTSKKHNVNKSLKCILYTKHNLIYFIRVSNSAEGMAGSRMARLE